jgi:hypothetical protein
MMARKKAWSPADRFGDSDDNAVSLFPDREHPEDWRVDYLDRDGGCYVTIFAGPAAEHRAREYFLALKGGVLKTLRAC